MRFRSCNSHTASQNLNPEPISESERIKKGQNVCVWTWDAGVLYYQNWSEGFPRCFPEGDSVWGSRSSNLWMLFSLMSRSVVCGGKKSSWNPQGQIFLLKHAVLHRPPHKLPLEGDHALKVHRNSNSYEDPVTSKAWQVPMGVPLRGETDTNRIWLLKNRRQAYPEQHMVCRMASSCRRLERGEILVITWGPWRMCSFCESPQLP